MTTYTSPRRRAAAALVATLTLAAPARAQARAQARRSGFMLGVHGLAVPGLAIGGGADQNGGADENSEFDTTFGGGAGLTVGYGLGGTFSLFGRMDGVRQKTAASDTPDGSWGLVHIELGVRANLPLGASTTPYLTGSYGGRSLAAGAH